MFASYTGILKRHDILINIIPYQTIYEQTIGLGANLVHDMIGTISCYNNGIGSLRVNIFV